MKLLRIDIVAKRLDCSKRQAYRLVSEGELEALKIGQTKGLRVSEDSLNNYIRKQVIKFQKENDFLSDVPDMPDGFDKSF